MPTNREQATTLRVQGWSYRQIGKYLGISGQRVHQIITGYKTRWWETPRGKEAHKRHGIKYRNSPQGKEATKILNRRFGQKVKEACLSHYAKGDKAICVRCGFSDLRALSIDHIDGNGHLHRQAVKYTGNRLYWLLIKSNYPKGYQTLCMNCQWIKRAENREVGGGGHPRK